MGCWVGHRANLDVLKQRNAYSILVWKPEVKRPLGKHRHRWEDNINLLKTECNLFYIWTQCIPRCKHSPLPVIKTSLLMFYKAKVAVCSEIHTKHINTMWAPHRIF
jgi:hypothetical protein